VARTHRVDLLVARAERHLLVQLDAAVLVIRGIAVPAMSLKHLMLLLGVLILMSALALDHDLCGVDQDALRR